MDITFQTGVFNSYRVLHKVHLGQFAFDLPENAILEFDGMTLKYGGQTYQSPAVAGAIRAGWFVPVEDTTTRTYAPKSAEVKVHSPTAQGTSRGESFKVTAVQEDEQEAGSLTQSAERRETARVNAATSTRLRPPVSVEPESGYVQQQEASKVAPIKTAKAFTSRQVIQAEDDQEGVVVSVPKSAQQAILTDDQEAVPVAKIGGSLKPKSFLVENAHDVAEALRRVESSKAKVEKFAATKVQQQEEVDIRQVHPTGATGDVAEARSGTELEDLLPEVTSSGKPDATISVPSTEAIQWDKSGHWRDRVKRALAYKDNPAAIESICAGEAKVFVNALQTELKKLGR